MSLRWITFSLNFTNNPSSRRHGGAVVSLILQCDQQKILNFANTYWDQCALAVIFEAYRARNQISQRFTIRSMKASSFSLHLSYKLTLKMKLRVFIFKSVKISMYIVHISKLAYSSAFYFHFTYSRRFYYKIAYFQWIESKWVVKKLFYKYCTGNLKSFNAAVCYRFLYKYSPVHSCSIFTNWIYT